MAERPETLDEMLDPELSNCMTAAGAAVARVLPLGSRYVLIAWTPREAPVGRCKWSPAAPWREVVRILRAGADRVGRNNGSAEPGGGGGTTTITIAGA